MTTEDLPAVTIGISFYNAEAFLLDAVRSVFAQTHENWELILIDDGSSDRSLEIARSITDPRVRVVSDGANRKLAARLVQIHSLAKHHFIARMDADDMMATDRLEKQLRFLQRYPDCDLVTTGVCSITDDSVPYGIRVPIENRIITSYDVFSGSHGITHASITGRKEWFGRNPYDPADERLQDYKLWVRAKRANDLNIGFIGEPLYYYRELGSMTPHKMLIAKRIRREVLRKCGAEMIGSLPTLYLLARSYLKSSVIWSASVLGGLSAIVKARNPIMSEGAFERIREDIDRILQTEVRTDGPGW